MFDLALDRLISPYILKACTVYNGITTVMAVVGLWCETESVLDFF